MGLPSAEAAAAGIIDIVNENMLGGLRLVSVQQGFDPRDFALVAFGGAGPLHANAMGGLTGAWPVIVPPSPGVLCALGDATTSLRDESARTCLRRFADLTGAELRDILTDCPTRLDPAGRAGREGGRAPGRLRGRRPLLRAGLRDPDHHPAVWLEDLDGVLPGTWVGLRHRARAAVLLPAAHRSRTGQRQGLGERAAAVDRGDCPRAEGDGDPTCGADRDSKVYVEGEFAQAGMYDRAGDRAGDVISGPAIVVEMDSTTLVLPGYSAATHPTGCLLIRPDAAADNSPSEG